MIENILLFLKIMVIYNFVIISFRLCFISRKPDKKMKYASNTAKVLSLLSDDLESFNTSNAGDGVDNAEFKRGLTSIFYSILAVVAATFIFVAAVLESSYPTVITMVLIILFKMIAYITSFVFWTHGFSNSIMQLITNRSFISRNAVILSIISLPVIIVILF